MKFKARYPTMSVRVDERVIHFKNYLYITTDNREIQVLSNTRYVEAVEGQAPKPTAAEEDAELNTNDELQVRPPGRPKKRR